MAEKPRPRAPRTDRLRRVLQPLEIALAAVLGADARTAPGDPRRHAAGGVLGAGFAPGRLADADAAGRAAGEEGDEGPEAGDAGADDAHGGFGGGPDGRVDVVPWLGGLLEGLPGGRVGRGVVRTCDVDGGESG